MGSNAAGEQGDECAVVLDSVCDGALRISQALKLGSECLHSRLYALAVLFPCLDSVPKGIVCVGEGGDSLLYGAFVLGAGGAVGKVII